MNEQAEVNCAGSFVALLITALTLECVCVRESVCVCVCVRERECVCVSERECVCV